jgi:hypothetical protein
METIGVLLGADPRRRPRSRIARATAWRSE